MIDVICTFCDKDQEKTYDIERMFTGFPDYFTLTFVDDRKEGGDISLKHRVVKTGGVGAYWARKKGFDETKEKYVWFIDVDDKILPFTFKDEGYDVTRFRWFKEDEKGVHPTAPIPLGETSNLEEIAFKIAMNALWCNVYKREILRKAFGDIGNVKAIVCHEDTLVNAACLNYIKKAKYDQRTIYKYRAKQIFWFSDHPEEATTMLLHLKGDARRLMKKAVDANWMLHEHGDKKPPYRLEQRVSFSLNRKCNRSCSYCNQRNAKWDELDDETIFKNFCACVDRAEKVFYSMGMGKRLVPQILGGEPALWSEDLIRRICDRLKDYDFYVFTNGTENEGQKVWHEAENAHFLTHLLDWKGKVFEKQERDEPLIVLTKNDIDDLESFLSDNPHVWVSFCDGCDEKIDWTDFPRIAEIEKRVGGVCQSAVNYLKHDLSETRLRCAEEFAVWDFDCVKMTATSCCQQWNKRVPINDFWGEMPQNCVGCLWFR